MVSNTALADINEITLAYYLAGRDWRRVGDSQNTRRQLELKTREVGIDHANAQTIKAKVMAREIERWSDKKVKQVWWVARPESLKSIVKKKTKQDIFPAQNPSDVLLLMHDGTLLGVSAKSTRLRSGGIQFKNLGVTQVEKDLNIQLASVATETRDRVSEVFELGKSQRQMTKDIQKKPHIMKDLKSIGDSVLKVLRDRLYQVLKTRDDEIIRRHLLQHWLNVGEMVFPPYVKVTGYGHKPPYTAKVETLEDQETTTALTQGKLTFEKQGDTTIGVRANGKKIMRMRIKWRDVPIASPLKFSGEPWK